MKSLGLLMKWMQLEKKEKSKKEKAMVLKNVGEEVAANVSGTKDIHIQALTDRTKSATQRINTQSVGCNDPAKSSLEGSIEVHEAKETVLVSAGIEIGGNE